MTPARPPRNGLRNGLRNYVTVTSAYWAFTLTDGALRMLVLLYLHQLGNSPLQIASLFLFYEFFGVVTNLTGAWIGARFGLKLTLVLGLSLQIVALSALASFADSLSLPLVMAAQALSGIAKDLTKMSAKSYIKFVVPEGDSQGLMRWVSLLTGSKNALKGAGFFLGGFLLTTLGFAGGCIAMAGGLSLALLFSALSLPPNPGKTKSKTNLRSLLSRSSEINWLSASRLFLFASRDVWFVLAFPLFLAGGLGWSQVEIGSTLALWVIGYGIVQSSAPLYLRHRQGDGTRSPPGAQQLRRWSFGLLLPLLGMLVALYLGWPSTPTLLLGLAVFAVVFASNSAIHSYLIIAYAKQEEVAASVGFYYMANAMGRLVGTVLSGALYQWAGLGKHGLLTCFGGSLAFVFLSALLCFPLQRSESRAFSRDVRPKLTS